MGRTCPLTAPFWEGAERALAQDPMALTVAMAGRSQPACSSWTPAGPGGGVGFLSLYYMTPAFRFRGLGVQLLGQAVSFTGDWAGPPCACGAP